MPGPKIVEKVEPTEKIDYIDKRSSRSKGGLVRKSSTSLPMLTKEKKRVQTFNQIYYRSTEIKFDEVQELIDCLKERGILISSDDNYIIKK